MALTGAWKSKQSIESGARKWGTGINPVHSVVDSEGRSIAPSGSEGSLPQQLESVQWQDADDTWGYDTDVPTNIEDRPRLGSKPSLTRSDAGNFPQWGEYENGLPGGSRVRSEDHGSADQTTSNQVPTETVTEGWRNKVTGTVDDAEQSDPSQLFMQTSMVQRDQVRAGSQRSGSASRFNAAIRSRIVGKKVKVYSGGRRHNDMTPREQYPIVRGWWARTAGTGYTAWLEANSQHPVQPVQRTVPSLPSVGNSEGTQTTDYGYQSEDVLPYV